MIPPHSCWRNLCSLSRGTLVPLQPYGLFTRMPAALIDDSVLSRGKPMLLKHVDQLVKEGKYEDALKVISRARAADPGNLYALAYEERVLALLNDHRHRVLHPGETLDQHLLPQGDTQVPHPAETEAGPEPVVQLSEDMRARVAMMLSRAHELRNRGEFDRALDEVSRAFLIDSSSPELIRLERQLWNERNISITRLKAKKRDQQPAPISRGNSVSSEDKEPVSDSGTPDEREPSGDEQWWQVSNREHVDDDRENVVHLQRSPDLPARDQISQTGHPFDDASGNLPIHRCVEEVREEMTSGAPADLGHLLARAESARQRRDYSAALALLTEAYTIFPDSREIRKIEMAVRREELLQHESG